MCRRARGTTKPCASRRSTATSTAWATTRSDPTGTVTREQAATIIGRLYKADPGSVSASSLDFKDKAKISSWSAGYIKAAVDKGFLAGYSDGTFRPTREVTRGEVAKIIYYYLGTSLSRAGKAYTGADLRGDTTNATISESCTLSDATIEGDLFITEGLGTDAVTLSNVTVEGTIIISGGTVTMTNTTSDHIIVSSAMGRLLQTTATGASRFSEAEVRTAAVLYEKVLTEGYDGFENVTVSGGNKVSLTVDADLLKLTVNAPATVTTTAAAKVYHLRANRAATVTGYGSVYQADVRTDGVSFTKDIALGGYTLASGVSVSVAGENRTASSTAAVSPSSVILDLGDEESLADGVEFSLPSGVTAEKLLLDSSELTGTAFETTSRGLRVKADTLKTLSTGSHTLTFRLSDGQTATVMVSATRETAAQPVQTAAFDRYYRSTNFRDISVKLEGVNAKSDIAKVVLGLTPLSYEFDEASRTLTLRRAALAQLPSGTYTVTVETQSGGSVQAVDLTVSDTTPAGVNALTAAYRSASPAAVRFAVPMQGRSVRSITVAQDGRAYTLNAGTDYFAASDGISLAANVLGRYGISGACTVYTAALSDNSIWLLAADCI